MRYEDYVALGETKHYEYYDGLCVVNPPSLRHVLATKRLARLLDDNCPPGFTSFPEAGWQIADRVMVEPDVMVAPIESAHGDAIREAPLLVVEIESPSTRDLDRGRKKELYAAGGAAWYWLVDNDARSSSCSAMTARHSSRCSASIAKRPRRSGPSP
jgi:Uma2 family endonuclease